jgi:hypothetical protein
MKTGISKALQDHITTLRERLAAADLATNAFEAAVALPRDRRVAAVPAKARVPWHNARASVDALMHKNASRQQHIHSRNNKRA